MKSERSRDLVDVLGIDGLEEAGPAGAGLELRVAREEGEAAEAAGVGAVLFVVEEEAAAGALRAVVEEDAALLGVRPAASAARSRAAPRRGVRS